MNARLAALGALSLVFGCADSRLPPELLTTSNMVHGVTLTLSPREINVSDFQNGLVLQLAFSNSSDRALEIPYTSGTALPGEVSFLAAREGPRIIPDDIRNADDMWHYCRNHSSMRHPAILKPAPVHTQALLQATKSLEIGISYFNTPLWEKDMLGGFVSESWLECATGFGVGGGLSGRYSVWAVYRTGSSEGENWRYLVSNPVTVVVD